jgi:hypothetical protein
MVSSKIYTEFLYIGLLEGSPYRSGEWVELYAGCGAKKTQLWRQLKSFQELWRNDGERLVSVESLGFVLGIIRQKTGMARTVAATPAFQDAARLAEQLG